MMTDREKIVDMVKMAGLVVAYPRPRRPRIPADRPMELFSDRRKGLIWATYLGFSCVVLGADLDASSMGGLGFGHNSSLFLVIMAPLTTSSFRSISNLFSLLIMDCKNLLMLLEYRAEDCPDILEGRSV